MEPTRPTGLLLGSSQEAAAQVFGASVDNAVTATFDHVASTDLAGVERVAVAAGPGMVPAVRALISGLGPSALVTIEVPSDAADAQELAGVLASVRLRGVARHAERPCLVLETTPASPSYDAAWVLKALLTAGSRSPDQLLSDQARLASGWELAAVRERSAEHERTLEATRHRADRLASQLEHVTRTRDRHKRRLDKLMASHGEAPEPEDDEPDDDRPPSAGANGPGVLAALSGSLGAQGRRGRRITLLALMISALVLVVAAPATAAGLGGPAGLLAGAVLALAALLAPALIARRQRRSGPPLSRLQEAKSHAR